MLEELIKDKVYYKIFDKTSTDLTHNYIIKDFENPKEIDQVKSNIDIIVNEFSANNLLLLNQVHGNNIICEPDFSFFPNPIATGDASITTQKNIILAIRTADCVPILFANHEGTVIGASHCGWRSAKLDIIKKLVSIMKKKTRSAIYAVIGPSISQKSYEVSRDFYQDFINESLLYKSFFIDSKKSGHYMFDLVSFIKLKLDKEDVKVIRHIDEDTYSMTEKYPSYRRCSHNGELYEQNILSAIMIV